MRNRRHQNNPIERLRLAVDCMPVATREAMLEGLLANERIIAGAYTDGFGGVCPMLAAHRRGGRVDFLSFAKAWDRFTRVSGVSRRASEREVGILISHLRASLEEADGLELDRAIADHRRLIVEGHRRLIAEGRRRKTHSLTDEHDPAGPIRARRLRRGVSGLLARRPPRRDRVPA